MTQRLLAFALLAVFGSIGLTYVDHRVDSLERSGSATPTRVSSLGRELALVRAELTRSQERLERYEADREEATVLGERLVEVEAELRCARAELDAQAEDFATQRRALEEGRARRERLLTETLGTRWRDLSRDLDARWENVHRTLEATAKLAQESRAGLASLERNMGEPADPAARQATQWAELMGPTVQLTDEATVGSGVLLASHPLPDGSGWRTYLLTAWHVVRDILDDPAVLDQPVPVHVYREEGGYAAETAHLVIHDANLDAALLVLDSTARFDHGARLASWDRLDTVRTFDEVYAVGCPLGNDPIPTRGEVADVHHQVDGQHYWMISAPTYIGNSGGGIYDAHTHELLGLFSKIYTHGNLRPTIVPHMGLVTPIGEIYAWMSEQGYASLVP
ncbi:MAG: trypsin-like peptidase domain-containing protein [Planctomycetes bacterium]|nr:trypsin-like peptidase domain-containing protein [Planctomycetota bacterium]